MKSSISMTSANKVLVNVVAIKHVCGGERHTSRSLSLILILPKKTSFNALDLLAADSVGTVFHPGC